MERNRLLSIASAYSLRLIFVLAPCISRRRGGADGTPLAPGMAGRKVAAWRWCFKHRSWVRQHGRELQQHRLVFNRVLARYLMPAIDPAMIDVLAPVW
jgi:hypothetical protein